MKLNALYVGVTDMNRSLNFYEGIFQRAPVQREDRFSMFDLGGVYFGLFNAAHDGEELIFGNNCVPNIEVDNVDAEYQRLSGLVPQIDPEVRAVGSYRYFQFRDEDGNWVELYETGK